MLRHLFLLIFIFKASTSLAAAQVSIEVLGLFKNRAVVKLNGQQKLLKLNQPGPYGVILREADSKFAMIEVAGQVERYFLGRSIGTQYRAREAASVIIKRNDSGQYVTVGSINGLSATFLVDTGANTVAMNENTAKRLGIDYRLDGEEGQAMTAGGITRSWLVKLDNVKVGEINVPNVRAAVIQGDSPHYVLLGMTYLDFVNFSEENQAIRLKKKF